MKIGARHAIPLARAREIIAELKIREPDEIDITAISFHYDVPVQTKSLRGMDGQLVRQNDRAVITVNSNVPHEAQKRFIIAHELGHFFLHPKARQFDEVCISQFSDWSEKQQIEELEANLFAAELLMPKCLLEPSLSGKVPSFELIRNLSKTFNTTLTSTAVRFVQATKEECAIVLSENRRRRWYIKSHGFSFSLYDEDTIHGHTCAAYVGPNKLQDRCEKLEAGFWLKDFRHDHKSTIVEEASYSTLYRSALSLLWINEAI